MWRRNSLGSSMQTGCEQVAKPRADGGMWGQAGEDPAKGEQEAIRQEGAWSRADGVHWRHPQEGAQVGTTQEG